MAYVDGYVVPVPLAELAGYRFKPMVSLVR